MIVDNKVKVYKQTFELRNSKNAANKDKKCKKLIEI